MSRQLLIEKYIKPSLIEKDGTEHWFDKNDLHHRKYRLPAIIENTNTKYDRRKWWKYNKRRNGNAEWWLHGKRIKTMCLLSKEEQIKQIFIYFSFDDMESFMKQTNWTWGSEKKVVKIDDLKRIATCSIFGLIL